MPFRVDSEVGRLRKVIVHRPGLEQRRLTPQTAAELLFDDVIWVRRAEEEHAAFVALLRERGVEFEADIGLAGGHYPSKGSDELGTWFRDSEGNLIGLGMATP